MRHYEITTDHVNSVSHSDVQLRRKILIENTWRHRWRMVRRSQSISDNFVFLILTYSQEQLWNTFIPIDVIISSLTSTKYLLKLPTIYLQQLIENMYKHKN